MESEFQHISRKTGRKPVSCKCQDCKNQCRTVSCLGTPSDILKILEAGFVQEIKPTDWLAGKETLKVIDHVIDMFTPGYDHQGCIFFDNGLCKLHDLNLKPTEGRLSIHTVSPTNLVPHKSIAYHVAKTWLDPKNEPIIQKIRAIKNGS